MTMTAIRTPVIIWAAFVGYALFQAREVYEPIGTIPDSISALPHSVSPLPVSWKQSLHFHVKTASDDPGCGGCMVLRELAASILELNITTTQEERCPTDSELAGSLASNRTIAIVYPESEPDGSPCTGDGTRVHIHWILAPLGTFVPMHHYRKWGRDDLVFHFASSTAVHPSLLPRSNILQVITGPKEGDEFDLPLDELNKPGRRGTLWLLRKARGFHSKLHYWHKTLPEPRREMTTHDPELFLQFEYFVSYDPYTFYSYAAAMMGAVSIVHPLSNVSKRDWVEGTYVGEYIKENGGDVPGIAYSGIDSEIEYANRTKHELRQFMLLVRRWGKEVTVERFTKDCYRFGVGERKFESALLAEDAYYRWYDEHGNLNWTLALTEAEKSRIHHV